jgi:hypothetical protein
MSFVVRHFEDGGTLGSDLNAMRRRLAISLDMAAKATRIQRRYLDALEKDAHDKLPEAIYTKNFIKTYVRFLGGDVGYFIKRYEEERQTCDLLVNPMRLPRQKVGWTKFLAPNKLITIGFIGLLFVAVLIYLGLQIQAVRTPPDIFINEPAEGIITDQARIAVSGQIETGTEVWVNEQKVLPDSLGVFQTIVNLERGVNIISIEASERYSKKQTIYRTVVFESGE